MNKIWQVTKLFALAILVLQISCKDSGTGPSLSQWEFLGFKDKFALRLVLAEPYLYVCAGSDGLWRRNIRQSWAEWEYVGLADTSLGRYFNVGVQHVLIHPEKRNWLLVAYEPIKGEEHVVYRSTDGGRSWAPADSGLEVYYGGERGFKRVERFLFYPEYILGAGHGIYVTRNFAEVWNNVPTEPGIEAMEGTLQRHSRSANTVWFGGVGLLFNPLLSSSQDGGFTWKRFNLYRYGVPFDNAVYSIAFDPEDANIVYVGMQGAVIKTTDGGESWIVPLVTHPQGAFFRAILSDPRDRQHYWVAAGRSLMETFDAGRTWVGIQSPNEHQVLHMLYDDITQNIYIATESGIYRYKP